MANVVNPSMLAKLTSTASIIPRGQSQHPPVLCVDLDGTIVSTDLLWESVLLLIKERPYVLFFFPYWLLRGKAQFKRKIAERIQLNPTTLPYKREVLEFLEQEKNTGRQIVMVTAADRHTAEPVARFLSVFSEIIASDGTINLSGARKRSVLESRFGRRHFDYLGNSAVDLLVWQSARAAFLVEPSSRILAQARKTCTVERVFAAHSNPVFGVLKIVRLHQWVKNVLIFVPVITAHKVLDWEVVLNAVKAFGAFSLCASSIYVINDLLDIAADRQHPKKRFRPLAAGTLSIPGSLITSLALAVMAFVISLTTLPPLFTSALILYFVLTCGYSFYFKKVPIADVLILAGLYTLRVIAGGVATQITISTWLLGFSMFLFLSLALAKRYAELNIPQVSVSDAALGRGYFSEDKQWVSSMGCSSGYLSILVLALYINSQEVVALYRHPTVLWLACPLLLYWVSRVWLLAYRGQLAEDPIIVTAADRVSYIVFFLISGVLILATV